MVMRAVSLLQFTKRDFIKQTYTNHVSQQSPDHKGSKSNDTSSNAVPELGTTEPSIPKQPPEPSPAAPNSSTGSFQLPSCLGHYYPGIIYCNIQSKQHVT